MGIGFKDDKGKFHPIQNGSHTLLRRKSATEQGLQDVKTGSKITQLLKNQVENFAKNSAKEFKKFQLEQEKKKLTELEKRRAYQNRIILSYKKARALGVRKPKELKFAILGDLPELSDNNDDLRFIEKVLNEFIAREKDFKKQIGDIQTKDPQTAKLMQEAFEKANQTYLNEFDTKAKKEETKKSESTNKRISEIKKELEKLEKGDKRLLEQEKKEKKVQEDITVTFALLAEAETDAEKEEINKKAQTLTKEAEKISKESADLQQDLQGEKERLEKKIVEEEAKLSTEGGFPSGIV